jgi:hypothetical protein
MKLSVRMFLNDSVKISTEEIEITAFQLFGRFSDSKSGKFMLRILRVTQNFVNPMKAIQQFDLIFFGTLQNIPSEKSLLN